MRKFIAACLLWYVSVPLGRLIAWLYPQSTVRSMAIWYEESQGKVRFLFGDDVETLTHDEKLKLSCSMRLGEWRKTVDEITKEISAAHRN